MTAVINRTLDIDSMAGYPLPLNFQNYLSNERLITMFLISFVKIFRYGECEPARLPSEVTFDRINARKAFPI